MTIPTPTSLRRIHRKLDHQRLKAGELHAKAQAVLARMFKGRCLRFSFDRRLGPTWQLSPSGTHVRDEVAQVVIADPDVVNAGDGLFTDGPAQTWRMVERCEWQTRQRSRLRRQVAAVAALHRPSQSTAQRIESPAPTFWSALYRGPRSCRQGGRR